MQTCSNCNTTWMDNEVAISPEDMVTLRPGDIVPSGRCPGCGAFCYPKPPLTDAWMEKAQASMNTIAREVNYLRTLFDEIKAPPALYAVGAVLADCLRMLQRTVAHELHLTMISEEQADELRRMLEEGGFDDEDDDFEEELEALKLPDPPSSNN